MRARELRERAGTLTGHAIGQAPETVARAGDTLLDDILTVVPTGEAKVMIGELDGHRSPALVDWGTIGLDVRLGGTLIEIYTDPGFEHAVIPIDHPIKVDDAIVEPGWRCAWVARLNGDSA